MKDDDQSDATFIFNEDNTEAESAKDLRIEIEKMMLL